MKTNLLLLIVGSSLLFTSCATLFSGTKQKVLIDSSPQGAAILIDGQNKGKTPTKVKMRRELNAFFDGGKEIQLELEGYEKNGYEVAAGINPVSVINLFNLLFWGVDAATGAVTKYDRYCNFEMIPLDDNKDSPTPKDDSDKYEKLTKLKKLLDDNVITQEEYDKEKAKILAK